MREFAEKFYKSKRWQKRRYDYAKSVHFFCERCLAKGHVVTGEIVHHITELTPENIDDPVITLDDSNLELVCRKCHGLAHHPDRRYVVRDGVLTILEAPPIEGLVAAPWRPMGGGRKSSRTREGGCRDG